MITIAVCFERIVMALGSGQYNWQDPMRNAGIIAQAEGNNIAAPYFSLYILSRPLHDPCDGCFHIFRSIRHAASLADP